MIHKTQLVAAWAPTSLWLAVALLAGPAALLGPRVASAQVSKADPTWCERHYSTIGGKLGTQDLPWEVSSPKGESYLPDVFYAEPIQNRQIMPTELELRTSNGKGTLPYRVHNVVYPTLGNPNLYNAADQSDALMVVLRLPTNAIQALGTIKKLPGAAIRSLEPAAAFEKRVSIFLVPRKGRHAAEDKPSLSDIPGVHASKMTPSCVMIRPVTGKMPAELTSRTTLQLVFDQEAMSDIPPGLYDLRLEWGDKTSDDFTFELHYNAVRVFPATTPGPYTVLNVADSQASVSDLLDGIPGEVSFRTLSERRLKAFVDDVVSRESAAVRTAAFIAFNGDLHNGGSPGSLLPETVGYTYREEARAIVTLLRELPLPIFLTAGNHDGYASTGAIPDSVRRATEPKTWIGRLILRLKGWRTQWTALGRALPLAKVVKGAEPNERWPDFDIKTYLNSYLPALKHLPGGWHRDIFTGVFARWDGRYLQSWDGWRRVADDELNTMLYDGFNQWRRSYGPLNFSHAWAGTHFISLNTYDLRQHRRTGWGMYTVNYGGGVGPVQSAWLNKQLGRSQTKAYSTVLLAHHDPRGGHNGDDFPYYFEQIDYSGMADSTLAFLKGEVIAPVLCESVEGWPESVLPASVINRCLHDGLQEWMRPDAEFDCAVVDRDETTGYCKKDIFDLSGDKRKHPIYSGFQLLHQIATRPSIRTLILGHTHYNSVEILQPGDALVPKSIVFDPKGAAAYIGQEAIEDAELALAELEIVNPMRRVNGERTDADELVKENRKARVSLDLAAVGHSFENTLRDHELVVLRMTTVADLSTQLVGGQAMTGYSSLHFNAQSTSNSAYELDGVTYYQWSTLGQGFKELGQLSLDRASRWPAMAFEDRLDHDD